MNVGDIQKITAFPCMCGRGRCEQGIEKQSRCPNFAARRHIVEAKWCRKCKCGTWHLDDKCVRCEAKKRGIELPSRKANDNE